MLGEKETVSVELIVEPEPPRQATLSPPVGAALGPGSLVEIEAAARRQ
jgi:hypothetical protein